MLAGSYLIRLRYLFFSFGKKLTTFSVKKKKLTTFNCWVGKIAQPKKLLFTSPFNTRPSNEGKRSSNLGYCWSMINWPPAPAPPPLSQVLIDYMTKPTTSTLQQRAPSNSVVYPWGCSSKHHHGVHIYKDTIVYPWPRIIFFLTVA